jgi:hypothetical protein
MKNRCTNPKCKDYGKYGARGIGFPAEWITFAGFLIDMGLRPSSLHSLERSDNNASYSKSNCVWATKKEQSRNRRFIKRYEGKTVWEWAAELGIKPTSFHLRLYRYRRNEITWQQLLAKPRDAWKIKAA